MWLVELLLLAPLIAAETPPADFKLEGKERLYSYSYGWPKEAVAIPALHRMLTEQMEEYRRWIEEEATSGKKAQSWFPEDGYETQLSWETEGQSERLLSLSGDHWTYTGGAHGYGSSFALLWDRVKHAKIEVPELFERPSEYTLLAPRYCEALNRERAERRDGEKFDSEFPVLNDAFNGCPKFSEITVDLVDRDKNDRFELLRFTADQYVAGPYAEGGYAIELAVTDRLIAAMKPDYRENIEVQPQ